MQARLLVADAGGELADVARGLMAEGYDVERTPAARLSSERLDELARMGEGPDALVLEWERRGMGRLAELAACLPVVVLLPAACGLRAADALRLGADDAVVLPVDPRELALRVARALERRRGLPGLGGRAVWEGSRRRTERLLGESAAIRAVRERIERVALGRATVLITGETGAGKELVATAVHECSPRWGRPFLKVNCAALPETLLESELFGHELGAFTGAERRRIGRFEEAHGGTLLLDEVGDMHPRTQAKVLRVLQEREFERVGGSRPIRVDVRILAATNQDLERAIEERHFRADLFYRLNVLPIHLPALRERREDVPLLAEAFLAEFGPESPRRPDAFSREALEAMKAYSWPGSVRELQNVVQRAALMADGPRIEVGDLALPACAERRETGAGLVSIPEGGVDYRDVERALILEALERSEWVQKDAAQLLGMTRRRMGYRIQRLGISHPRWRRRS